MDHSPTADSAHTSIQRHLNPNFKGLYRLLGLGGCVLLGMLGVGAAHLQGPYSMTLISESNAEGDQAGVLVRPGGSMSVCAVLRDAQGVAIGPSGVTFRLLNAPATWTVLPQSGTPDPICKGFHAVVTCDVIGQGQVRARWSVGPGGGMGEPEILAEKTIAVEAKVEPCPNAGVPTPAGAGIMNPACNLKWTSNSNYEDTIINGVGVWSTTGLVRIWPGSGDDWNIHFWDECRPGERYYAETIRQANKAEIAYNVATVDPCPAGSCVKNYPNYLSRHHMLWLTAHEVGHALGLAPHPNHMGALMFDEADCYFMCGTEEPQPDDLAGMAALGYVQCQ